MAGIRVVKPEGVLETCLYAEDLGAMEEFFVRVVGLEVLTKEAGRHVFFRCGGGMVLVFNPSVTARQLTSVNGSIVPLAGTIGAGHLAFRVPAHEVDAWREHLLAHNIVIESEVRWPQGGHSIYVRDPGGNSLELATPQLWGLT
jgi:catechol 2,3-dioxygenase-like lactoylglutathione lyase family enzyme